MAGKKKATAQTHAKAAPKKPSAASGTPTPAPTKASATAPTKASATPPARGPGGAGDAGGAPGAATRKAPRARRPPVESHAVTRPDPDQPPTEDTAARTSVYSEWLNQAPAAPAWLNSPPPRKPSPTAKRRAAAKAAEPPDPMQRLLNDQPPPPPPLSELLAPSASRPAPRPRTTARRITQAERLSVTSAELEAVFVTGATRSTSPAVPAASYSTNRRATTGAPVAAGTRASGWEADVRNGSGGGDARVPPVANARGNTSGRYPTMPPPATLGQTAGRVPSTSAQTAARLEAARSGTHAVSPATPAGTDTRLPVMRQTTAGLPAARPETDSEALLIRGARRAPVTTTGPVAPRRKGPHPLLTQAAVVLGTIVILLVTVTITSPLGYGAAISGTFQAYARPFILVPTPTPKPTPVIQSSGGTEVSPGTQVVIDDIKAVFGQYASGALNVSRCESGYDPNARNPYAVGNSHAEGVFQILYPSTWDGTSYRAQNPYNYDANIHAAYEIFSRDGYSWREWQCQP